jgi:enterochelin esterase family protein
MAVRSIAALLALLIVAAPARAQPAAGSAGRPASGFACAEAGATSPAVDRLRAALEAADAATVDTLVRCLAAIETPVIEPAPSPGSHLVTFPFVGDSGAAGVRLDSNVVAVLIDGIEENFESLGAMDRIPETDLWVVALELPDSLRAPYRFEVTPTEGEPFLVLDPRNPRVYEDHWTENFRKSEVVLPDAPAQPWRARPGRAVEWEVHEVAGRELAVYVPPAATQAGTPRPVVLALGTMTFYNILPTARLIDHLVETGAIEPPIVITLDLADGAADRRYAGEAAFLADTLLPWARSRWPISTAPEEVIVTGTSRRGLAATIAAFERPDAVGMALPLSGSFYWRPEGEEEFEWLTRRFAEEPRRHIELYVTAGTLETVVTPTNRGHYQLATARHLRDVLEAKEYDFVYMEFVGVHDEINWQSALADGLRALLPRR